MDLAHRWHAAVIDEAGSLSLEGTSFRPGDRVVLLAGPIPGTLWVVSPAKAREIVHAMKQELARLDVDPPADGTLPASTLC